MTWCRRSQRAWRHRHGRREAAGVVAGAEHRGHQPFVLTTMYPLTPIDQSRKSHGLASAFPRQ